MTRVPGLADDDDVELELETVDDACDEVVVGPVDEVVEAVDEVVLAAEDEEDVVELVTFDSIAKNPPTATITMMITTIARTAIRLSAFLLFNSASVGIHAIFIVIIRINRKPETALT